MTVATTLGELDVVVLDYGGTIAPDGPKDVPADKRVDMPLFPEAAWCIGLLHDTGLRIIVASNTAGHETRHPMLERAGVADCIEAVLISTRLGYEKPESGFYEAIINQAGCPPERIVHVGNRLDFDVQRALDHHMRAIWVCRAQGYREYITRVPTIGHIAQLPATLFGPMSEEAACRNM